MALTPEGTSYEIAGPEGAPVVMLIHGLGLTRATWDGHMAALAARYRVVRYDLYGHGKSALPPKAPSLRVFSEQIVALLDRLGIDAAALVGFSLGGMINRRAAMDHPRRVSCLGILNSPHERGEAAQDVVEARARETGEGGIEATIDATLARWFTSQFMAQHPEEVAKVRAGVLANNPAPYTQCRWVLAHGVRELIRPEPPILHPTLVMTCENDTGSTPRMSREIGREIQGAEVRIVPDLQHMGLVERPELFTGPLLDFLDRLTAETGA